MIILICVTFFACWLETQAQTQAQGDCNDHTANQSSNHHVLALTCLQQLQQCSNYVSTVAPKLFKQLAAGVQLAS
jgi:hypothetical protein